MRFTRKKSFSPSPSQMKSKKQELEAFLSETMSELFNFMEREAVTAKDYVQPWKNQGMSVPFNAATGHRFRGGNQFRLMLWSIIQKYNDPRFMTFTQAEEMGCRVMKGAKGIKLLRPFVRTVEADAEIDPHEITSPEEAFEGLSAEREFVFFKPYHVFNGSQIEGLEPLVAPEEPQWNEESLPERLFQASGARCEHFGDVAAYNYVSDCILLPPKAQFEDEAAYIATKMHEWYHWTGHSSRESRDITGGFGSPAYAMEELRAEIFSLCIGKAFDLPFEIRTHAAYIASWKERLAGDIKEVFGAASQAMEMLELVTDFNQGLQPKAAWFPEVNAEQLQRPEEAISLAL